ncbi:MAG: fluoride efflux transporter CrcB [Chthoniobacterales bacterium]
MSYFWVAIGGAIGSTGRFWISGLVAEAIGHSFPYGTLTVNISGSFLVGALAGLTVPEGRWFVNPSAREFLMIGLCGGYTTFSSFSLQTLALAHDGQWFRAGMNCVASVVLCLIAVWLGYACGNLLNRP